MTILYDSILLALKKHRYQKYGNNPYINHLFNVYILCSKYSKSEVIRCSAILHDILEDTDTNIKELEVISEEVAEICLLLSKNHNKEYYKNIALNDKASFVKIADRICNIKESIEIPNLKMLLKYKEEIKEYKLLRNDLTNAIYDTEFIPISKKLIKTINNFQTVSL